MKLSPEAARWLVSLRWLACVFVFAITWVTSAVLDIVPYPWPLYVVGSVMVCYNLLFLFGQRDWTTSEGGIDRHVFRQIMADLVALSALLYFADLSRNPFLFFFVFHMIIASMYLHGVMPWVVAGLATTMVGTLMLFEHLAWIPDFPIRFPTDPPGGRPLEGFSLLAMFSALASTLGMTVYFTTSIHRYVDRAHAEIRQKEKMLGIGQLVAGIAHQIANPLDGVQNCLRRIGEGVKDDPRLNEYVQLMAEALERIERTAKRVQAFSQPRGITLESTDVNGAVEATLAVLGTQHGEKIEIEMKLGNVPPVQGDPYTLQEVLFNLCTNALAAMPGGGTLSIGTVALNSKSGDRMDAVAVEVTDTGVGIPKSQLEKIFEPFFTTRADSGGTGMGLGLCRMLIAEMGGRIQVRSVLDEGTTFTVFLGPAKD